ncbi:DUF4129 domain-containing protein [Streptomyces sp. NPDC006552]|uniref:DUF4129 domain-containing protein n=1 Tax=Streptomyces sp. NPDC006552 TaxID=3157179 RepID=UPI0033BD560F
MRGGQDGRGTTPGRWGTVLAVGVVGVLAAAAWALRGAPDLLRPGRGRLGDSGLVTLGLVAAWTAGCTVAARRLRPRIEAGRSTPPAEERLRLAALRLLLAAPALLGVLALVLHRFTWDGPPPNKAPGDAPVPTVAPLPGTDPGGPPAAGGDQVTSWLYAFLGAVGACAAAALLVLLAVLVRRRWRRGLLTPPPRTGPAAAGDDEDRALLLSALGPARRALADGGDARAAVIACYAAMEEALAVSGVGRRPSDSPAEFLTRAARGGLVTGPAAPRLTALFREARYSSHPMAETQRAAAAEALEEIAAQLDAREAARLDTREAAQ